jgi:FkbM family methyltransferase
MSFYAELIKVLLVASKNNFSFRENYDQLRFGTLEEDAPVTLNGFIRKKLERLFESKGYTVVLKEKGFDETITEKLKILDPYLSRIGKFYDLLEDDLSRDLLLQLVAFRVLGLTKVKLPLNTPDFWNGINEIEALADQNNYLQTSFMNWRLPLIDITSKGIPIQFYFLPGGVYIDFFVKQYQFNNGSKIIKAEKGDYVIDAGGCWGDTALYFSWEVGESGKVFTFEFIPSNIEILLKNLSLNPDLEQRVTLINRPVWENSNETMYYIDNGPGSRVFMKEEESFDGKSSSLSIDDLVAIHSIPRVDFIKMDIEGAEPYALRGAVETIKKFKPKLAIAIYHSLEDFVNIPKFIHDLGLGYELYLAHCSIHQEESILFAEIPIK